jgi:hypothetical protein
MLLKTGDSVTLRDSQSILENNYVAPTFVVQEAREFLSELSSWEIYRLDEELFLVYQMVGNLREVGVYFEAETFIGNRKDSLNGMQCLWENPNLNIGDLTYANRIPFGDTEYVKKMDSIGCEVDGMFGLVTEWEAPYIENNQLMVLEVGEGEDGGNIVMLRGSHISEHEVEILRS